MAITVDDWLVEVLDRLIHRDGLLNFKAGQRGGGDALQGEEEVHQAGSGTQVFSCSSSCLLHSLSPKYWFCPPTFC